MIVKADSDEESFPYEGMDRPTLGSFRDIPEDLILRGMALEDLPNAIAESHYRELLSDIAAAGGEEYQLLALGDAQQLHEHEWDFLGFDVGENTPASWSAIANRGTFLSSNDLDDWKQRLNPHGLFGEFRDAEAYLARYMASNDPDKGWTEEGWVDEPDIYAVIPVYRYKYK